MRKKNSILMIITFLTISFCVPVYASENTVPSGYLKSKDMFYQIMKDVGYIGTLPIRGFHQALNEFLNAKGLTGEAEQIETDEDALNYVNNGISVQGENNVVLNGNSLEFTKWFINKEIEEHGFRYVYTFNIINHATEFASGDAYQITRDFIQTYQPEGKVCAYSNYYRKIMLADLSNCAFVRTSDVSCRYEVTPYNLDTWEPVRGYEYSFNGSEYVATGASGNQMRAQVKVAPTQTGELGLWSWCTSGRNNVYKMYLSLADLKADSVGQAPYYINNSVYDNFSNSNNTYTITTDNSNKISYGDVTNYINSYNTENGKDPSPTDINIYIDNNIPDITPTPTPNPDNPSGNGTFVNNNSPVFNNNPNININLLPGDGTVSGNGTGEGSGIGNIFGFLSDIGKFLGDLIKNLGQALVDVIKGIGDLLNSIITDLPTVFFDFLGSVFSWLPEEWVRLMGLSFACMLIVGVIKIFRR